MNLGRPFRGGPFFLPFPASDFPLTPETVNAAFSAPEQFRL